MSQKNLSAKFYYTYLNLSNGGTGIERIGKTLFRSKIELTPHQISAALFAFKSPFNKGVILADEVGLGKTIEAGIVIAQYLSEKKNRILIVAPASLQRQWECELFDKFGIESIIMDRKTFVALRKQGFSNPFIDCKKVVICSYQACSKLNSYIKESVLDLVVIDEAHKLRNVYTNKAITSKNVLSATEKSKKLLLTATPIQNSLMDLFGLSLFIDPNIFPDKSLFRKLYISNYNDNLSELEERLKGFLHRTLRSQVDKYLKFTKRIPKTFSFNQTHQESLVYNSIRELILSADKNKYIIPPRQKHLLLLVLCKLMGSSMHAIVYTLNKIKTRLLNIRETGYFIEEQELNEDLDDFEIDEFDEVDSDNPECIDIDEINREINVIEEIIKLASSVKVESKYIALQNALHYSFQHLRELGAEEKVVIFTESRKTQEYIYQSLVNDGYDGVITFSGTNNDDSSNKIYNDWISRPENEEYLSRSRAINVKTAILEKFREDGKILIATEAGAEGLNLQYCSLVINYDLPWNPQRVEQRIGRCHRFGQQFDVVVINFISRENIVEQRIFELLDQKYSLFTEVLGSTDEVLGTLEKGDNLANAIIDIYVNCRSSEEINEAFDLLQETFKDDIESTIKKTKQALLDNFDEDLQQYFSTMMDNVNSSLSEYEKYFWQLTKAILANDATFNDNKYFFQLNGSENIYAYTKDALHDCIIYNYDTEMGKNVLALASNIDDVYGLIEFNKTMYPYKVSVLDNLVGKHGYMLIKKVNIQAINLEQYLAINAILDDGTRLDESVCRKLFRLDTKEFIFDGAPNSSLVSSLFDDSEININRIVEESLAKNNDYVQKEIDRINLWADDKIQSTQLSVELMREERKKLQTESELASNMLEKKEIEEKIIVLSKKIKQAWISLADAEDEIETQRKHMISEIKKINYGISNSELVLLVEFRVV